MRKDVPSKWTSKSAGVSIFISHKTGFKPKLVRRDKEDYFIFIKQFIKSTYTEW
jgi:hypothetical protein